MTVTLTIDNDTTFGGPCGCRVLLNALEHYEIYLQQSANGSPADYGDELATLHRVKADYLDGLVSSLENAERRAIGTIEGGRSV